MCSGVEEGDLAVIWRELIHGLRHEKTFTPKVLVERYFEKILSLGDRV